MCYMYCFPPLCVRCSAMLAAPRWPTTCAATPATAHPLPAPTCQPPPAQLRPHVHHSGSATCSRLHNTMISRSISMCTLAYIVHNHMTRPWAASPYQHAAPALTHCFLCCCCPTPQALLPCGGVLPPRDSPQAQGSLRCPCALRAEEGWHRVCEQQLRRAERAHPDRAEDDGHQEIPCQLIRRLPEEHGGEGAEGMLQAHAAGAEAKGRKCAAGCAVPCCILRRAASCARTRCTTVCTCHTAPPPPPPPATPPPPQNAS
jgi:hypothetical protein